MHVWRTVFIAAMKKYWHLLPSVDGSLVWTLYSPDGWTSGSTTQLILVQVPSARLSPDNTNSYITVSHRADRSDIIFPNLQSPRVKQLKDTRALAYSKNSDQQMPTCYYRLAHMCAGTAVSAYMYKSMSLSVEWESTLNGNYYFLLLIFTRTGIRIVPVAYCIQPSLTLRSSLPLGHQQHLASMQRINRLTNEQTAGNLREGSQGWSDVKGRKKED